MASPVAQVIDYLKLFSLVVGVITLLWKVGRALNSFTDFLATAKDFITDMRREMTELKGLVYTGVTNHLEHIQASMESLAESVKDTNEVVRAQTIENVKVQAEMLHHLTEIRRDVERTQ